MKKFVDLLVYEIDRIKYAYLLMIGIIAGMQTLAIVLTRYEYMKHLTEYQKVSKGNVMDFLGNNGPLSFIKTLDSDYYFLSIALSIFVLILYAIVIWYRDWYGKNSFSYRLLTLPGSRMSIFFAKFLTILFMIFGLLAIQLVLIVLEEKLLGLITPSQLYEATSFRQSIMHFPLFYLILPTTLIDFIVHYTVGIGALAVGFTMILMELSFKWKGILIDIGIFLVGLISFRALFLSDIILYLYPKEFLIFLIAFGFVLFIISVLVSRVLLNRKINV